MERIIQYIWKYKLYTDINLITTDGTAVSIIDPGLQNTDAGPDFFNAKIKIGETLWAGSVEIHTKASDWIRHNHHLDKTYDTVILHVVHTDDMRIKRTCGELIPQIVIEIPEKVKRNIQWLLTRELPVPCIHQIKEIDSFHLGMWLDCLLSERLERKTKDILCLLEQYKNDWNEVCYIILSRNFGFGVNNDAFERLARSLPLQYIRKQRGSSSQVESMFFGQAGLLQEENTCDYFQLLKKEYEFLKNKFNLVPLDESIYKSLRTRPINFPHLKLAQLAALWIKYDNLFSMLLHAGTIESIKSILRISPSMYWETHYHFRYNSPKKEKILGDQSLNIIIINTVAPLLFAYGLQTGASEYTEKAVWLLEHLPPEKNHITTLFANAQWSPRHAGDSQSFIQLKREYCEKKKCLYCRIGFQLLKRINNEKMS